ncbi:MAG: hypothetical protein L3K14_03175 [Thermoplasmata archaeon]|nr:hypothetical protein [Thermoplasmata archaeon]
MIIWPGEGGDWKPLDGLRTFDARTIQLSILGDRANLQRIYEERVVLDKRLRISTTDGTFSLTDPKTGKTDSVTVRLVTGPKSPKE